jgi:two-component system, chemotaxis family, protein-glutamate methylesterase/glutaminase
VHGSESVRTGVTRLAQQLSNGASFVQPIRVLIVDDSAVVRRMLGDVLASDPELVVAGSASSGQQVLERIADLKPDLVTLDVEMPGMNGIATLVEIRKVSPRLPVIMFSSLTGPAAAATVEALARGASDYVTKPTSFQNGFEVVRNELLPKIKALCKLPTPSTPAPPLAIPTRSPLPARVDILAIGSSTGGPNALVKLIPELPADFCVPIVVVQHMPPMFTNLLSIRLDGLSKLKVQEARDGEKLERGHVRIAPGDYHMVVSREGRDARIGLNKNAPENSCRPAVDSLFRSLALSFGPHVLAVVLTGMGCDGTRGADAIRQAGGSVIVQDETSSVVWGMPGSIVGAGLANKICPLDGIASEVVRRTAPLKAAAGHTFTRS